MYKFFLILFILLSFITHTMSDLGTNIMLSRITLSDMFGFLALFFGIQKVGKGLKITSKFNPIFKNGFIMILCFFLPIFFSLQPEKTIIEVVIVFFLILIAVLIFYNFKDDLINGLLPLLIITVIIATSVAVFDTISPYIGLPRLFAVRTVGEVFSGFRNAGQAGAYLLVFITILYPLSTSNLSNYLSKTNKKLLSLSIACAFIYILLTGKIAAYIGLLIGIILFGIMKRNLKTLISVVLISSALYFFFQDLKDSNSEIYNRIMRKYNARIDKRINGGVELEGDFLAENLKGAIEAFEDRPLIGSGLGAFAGKYSTHEVHSTYFKMIGETGVIGVIGYIIFIITFLKMYKSKKYKNSNPYADYLNSMFPFVIGCFVSWGYTYHLRKREFWILLAVVLIVSYRLNLYNKMQDEKLIK